MKSWKFEGPRTAVSASTMEIKVSVRRIVCPAVPVNEPNVAPPADWPPWYLEITIDRGTSGRTKLDINHASEVPVDEWQRIVDGTPTPYYSGRISVEGDMVRIQEKVDCCSSCVSPDVTVPWREFAPPLAVAVGLPLPAGLGDDIKGDAP